MYLIITLLILTLITLAIVKLFLIYKNKVNFFIEGINLGFSFYELKTLWKCAIICNLKEPISLFISEHSLTKCITQIKNQAENENSAKLQNLLSKLYSFRTKQEKAADKKRGLESTQSLTNGQKLRIILPGKGVFSSEIVNNGREMIIRLPTQHGQITKEGPVWVGKTVNIYLWRTGDARYVFDTTVNKEGIFLGKPCLYLKHTVNLLRTQKRNAVRAKCHILSELYIITENNIDYNKIETKKGYKCLIEDISENGALIRIRGKGLPNFQIRLQFQLQNKLIVMFGIIRTVEYDEENKQSRLHFECIHIEDIMRNQVLSYVYNILPQNEKEIFDAFTYIEEDEKNDNNDTDETEMSNENEIEEKKDSSVPNYDNLKNDTDNIQTTDDIISSVGLDNDSDLEPLE